MKLEAWRGCLLVLLAFFTASLKAQFIAHFNARGLRGNITFDIRAEQEPATPSNNASFLLIECQLESEAALKSEPTEPVLFEWNVHFNTLAAHMLASCAPDELGTSTGELMSSSLSSDRQCVLNKPNSWTIPLSDVVQSKPVRSLSALLWGKSVSLRLAGSERPASGVAPSTSGSSSPRAPNLAKPASQKPTFAPRPKPSLGKPKAPSLAPMLPKPEAIVAEQPAQTRNESLPVQPVNALETSQTLARVNETSAAHKRLLRAYSRTVVCANIVDSRNVKTVEAVFDSEIAGKVTIRGNEDDISLIWLNLYHVRNKVSTRHDWKILASDILDERRHEEKCKYLQTLFDPNNVDDTHCAVNETTKCRMGDLTRKHGPVQVAGLGKSARSYLVDLNLPLSALESSRSLYLVVYEVAAASQRRPTILSCAQIRTSSARKLEATFNMEGVRGSVRISQRHPTEPAQLVYDLFGLEGNTRHLSIRELPVAPRASSDNNALCNALGDLYNPNKRDSTTTALSTTQDAFPAGNLTGKHGQLAVIDSEYEDHYMGELLDLSLQLWGPHSAWGRAVVVHKNNGEPWVCANLELVDQPLLLAEARFYYPLVGRISFQQLLDEPHAETSVLVDLYNPNGERDSSDHAWMVHLQPAMADFYNWSARCESAGEPYDPLQAAVGLSAEQHARNCASRLLAEPMRCRAGDLALKAARKLHLPMAAANRTRFFYLDPFLPLAETHSILGRSIVVYDEQAPTQRGNKLTCATIRRLHPLKAAVRSWDSGPSIPSQVSGQVSFDEEAPGKATRVQLELAGFNGNVEHYALHQVWTQLDREFPCSNDSLYQIYDPFDNEHSLRLPPSAHYGALATVDRVKVGDMSRKHGSLEGLQSVQRAFSDANLPLFAPRSIVGRSLVLRAAVNDFRWVCGNVELDYDKATTRQIVGLASFDEPRSKVAGFVRFVQLEHNDGSLSDTYLQVDLKLQSDGIHEPQVSEAHNWAVFVNQVGEDAFIAADEVRCIAAGFKWNPYLAQDSLESYPQSCTPNEQLACAMGDLGMRHGQLILGPNNRRALSDSNLPLVGNFSVMGRSLVVFDNKRPNVKLACANIFPDIHLKSNVVIKRTPSFTVAKFIEQMRLLLGAAEWLMVPELKATKAVANGECVQMTIHFYGPKAHQMQVELNNLITLGTVRKSTRIGVDKISTHFKLCRTGQMQLTSSASSNLAFFSLISISIFYNMLKNVQNFK